MSVAAIAISVRPVTTVAAGRRRPTSVSTRRAGPFAPTRSRGARSFPTPTAPPAPTPAVPAVVFAIAVLGAGGGVGPSRSGKPVVEPVDVGGEIPVEILLGLARSGSGTFGDVGREST